MAALHNNDTFRVFFALWPGPGLQQKLHRLACKHQARTGGKPARSESIHLTLLFLGQVEAGRLRMLEAAAGKVPVPAFSLSLDSLGCWPRQHLAYAAPAAPCQPLSALVENLRAQVGEAGFAFDSRKFKPHVTLLRKVEHPFPACRLEPTLWDVHGFDLVASVPVGQIREYRRLATWPAPG